MNRETSKYPDRDERSFTLVELLVAMAILSVILLVLAEALSASLRQFSSTTDRSNHHTESAAALEWLHKDLQSAVVTRPARVPRIQGISADQAAYFEEKVFFPFEIDRTAGAFSSTRSFENGERPPDFSQLAFVARPSAGVSFSAALDHQRFQKNDGDEAEGISYAAQRSANFPAIVGYYVAFTKDSPFTHDTRASMKLFRHFRPGGNPAKGYADGFLTHVSHLVNKRIDQLSKEEGDPTSNLLASVRDGKFENVKHPFLFDGNIRNPLESIESEFSISQPWPTYGLGDAALPVPVRGSWSEWKDARSKVHDEVFPDEAIAYNVVRFECEPYRIVVDEDTGLAVVQDAPAVNADLELTQSDWPCLVAPDFVDITLGLVDEDFSTKFSTREDWLVDWSKSEKSPRRILIERNVTVHKIRIFLKASL